MLHFCFQCISDAERARATVGSTPGCPYSWNIIDHRYS
jgi:hypothetical protein